MAQELDRDGTTLPAPAALDGELLTPEVARGLENAKALAQQARADGTLDVYRRAWERFQVWCARNALQSLPCTPETLASYLGHLAPKSAVVEKGRVVRKAVPGLSPSRLEVIRSAIRRKHLDNDLPPPDHPKIAEILKGARRSHRGGKRQVAALTAVDAIGGDDTPPLFRVLDAIDTTTVRGVRDRALLLVGFAAALRRSEIASLTWGDIAPARSGINLVLRRSKTDKANKGQEVGVGAVGGDACPVAALEAWKRTLLAAGFVAGCSEPVFRAVDRTSTSISHEAIDPKTVNRTIKRLVEAAGLDPSAYGGHSMRAGFVTTAVADGQSIALIQKTTRHRDPKTLLDYARVVELAETNAVRGALARRGRRAGDGEVTPPPGRRP